MITIEVRGGTREELGIVEEAEADWRNDGFQRVAKAARILEQAVKRKYSRLRGTVSLPGDPPAMQTGELYRSVNRTPPRLDRNGIVSIVGATAFFAKWIEYGGLSWGRHYRPPRPAWRPATLESLEAMEKALEGK